MKNTWKFDPLQILSVNELVVEVCDGVEVGHTVGYDIDLVIKFFNLWCIRIDKRLGLIEERYTRQNWMYDELVKWRGYTFSEFRRLYNTDLQEEELPLHPVFHQLNRSKDRVKGGINTRSQWKETLLLYPEYDHETYLKTLKDSDLLQLVSFFFNQFPACVGLEELYAHVGILAPSRSGKTFLIRTWLHRLINKYKDHSFVIIDPHGDYSKKMFESTLLRDRERFIYLDVRYLDEGYSFSYNVFDVKGYSPLGEDQTIGRIEKALTEIVTTDRDLSDASSALLTKCVHFLLRRKNSTIQDLYDLITLQPNIWNEAQKHDKYFEDRNFQSSQGKTRDAIARRLIKLVTGTVPKALLSSESSFDLEAAINSNKVIIVNLDGLGPITKEAFGKFLIANINNYVDKRDALDPNLRHTIVAVDEWQNFISADFGEIMEQRTKKGLHMMLANQNLEQLGSHQYILKNDCFVKVFAGESSKEVAGFVDVPKFYLKGAKHDKEGSRDLDIKKYEFLLKVRNKQMRKITSPTFLLKDKYKLSTKEVEENEKYMLEKYYKKIDLSYTTADAAISTDSGRGKPPRDLDEPE